MSESFKFGGEKYKLEGNPTLGTVRKVQGMQTDLLLRYLDEDQLREMESLEDESEVVQAIIDSGGMEAFEEVQWRRSMLEPVQTISLAADHPFDPEDFDKMPANEYMEAKENAEEALGGDVHDFFNKLGIGTSLTKEEMEQMR